MKKQNKTVEEIENARIERENNRKARIKTAYAKAAAWESARGLANKAGAHERLALLSAAALLNDSEFIESCDEDEEFRDVLSRAREYVLAVVRVLATDDLRAVLTCVPDHVLAKAVRADGALKVSTIAREMAAEIAANPETALAVAQAASEAQRKANRKARKAAKAAEKKATEQSEQAEQAEAVA